MQRITEKPQHALVFGGTGFIGYHIVQALLANDFKVTLFSRNPEKTKALFTHSNIETVQGDINTISETELIMLLRPFDKLVFAAGVDERVEPEGDTWTFFKHANVDSCEKLFRATQQSNITHAVLLSSIFLNMARAQPELKLAEKHAYIRSRVEQNDISQALAKDHFILTALEVPWVFGVSPHTESQWRTLINYVRTSTPLLSCRGGVNVIAVQSIGEACAGALLYPTQSSLQTIGDLNLTHEQLVMHLCDFVGRNSKNVTLLNDTLFQEIMRAGGLFKDIFDWKSGLDIRYLPELLTQNIYVDNVESQKLLRYSTGKALEAIEETVQNIPEHGMVKSWRKVLNVFSPTA